jgi:hypothetical protein
LRWQVFRKQKNYGEYNSSTESGSISVISGLLPKFCQLRLRVSIGMEIQAKVMCIWGPMADTFPGFEITAMVSPSAILDPILMESNGAV